MEEVMCRMLRHMIEASQGKDIEHLRAQMGKMDSLAAFSKSLKKVTFSEQILADTNCLVMSPVGSFDTSRVVLYLHGGGYVMGSPKGYQGLIADVCLSSNCMVVAPSYRLAPEVKFPIPQSDCLAVANAFFELYKDSKKVLVGDSAGAALVLATTLALAQQGCEVDAAVLMSPWVDPLANGGTIVSNADSDFLVGSFLSSSFDALMQGQTPIDSRVCLINAQLTSLPRTLVQYGSGELFFDQISQFVERAKSQGVNIENQVYEDQCHDFQIFTAVSKNARQAVERIGDFVRST